LGIATSPINGHYNNNDAIIVCSMFRKYSWFIQHLILKETHNHVVAVSMFWRYGWFLQHLRSIETRTIIS